MVAVKFIDNTISFKKGAVIQMTAPMANAFVKLKKAVFVESKENETTEKPVNKEKKQIKKQKKD